MFSFRAYIIAIFVSVASAFAPIARGMFFHDFCAKIDEKTTSALLLTFVSLFSLIIAVASRMTVSKMAPAQMAPTDAVVEASFTKFSQVMPYFHVCCSCWIVEQTSFVSFCVNSCRSLLLSLILVAIRVPLSAWY